MQKFQSKVTIVFICLITVNLLLISSVVNAFKFQSETVNGIYELEILESSAGDTVKM